MNLIKVEAGNEQGNEFERYYFIVKSNQME